MTCLHKKIIGELCFDRFKEELSRTLPKHTSHCTTMVDWIEKEVEASLWK